MSDTVSEYCPRCECVKPVVVVRGATYTEWKCKDCGWQHDCECDDYEGDTEPIGSCDNCGTNLYSHDDDFLCDQCLWHVQTYGRMR